MSVVALSPSMAVANGGGVGGGIPGGADLHHVPDRLQNVDLGRYEQARSTHEATIIPSETAAACATRDAAMHHCLPAAHQLRGLHFATAGCPRYR